MWCSFIFHSLRYSTFAWIGAHPPERERADGESANVNVCAEARGRNECFENKSQVNIVYGWRMHVNRCRRLANKHQNRPNKWAHVKIMQDNIWLNIYFTPFRLFSLWTAIFSIWFSISGSFGLDLESHFFVSLLFVLVHTLQHNLCRFGACDWSLHTHTHITNK